MLRYIRRLFSAERQWREALVNDMPNIFNFLKEVREELEKVAWPTRQQTTRYTILVIIVALAVGVFLGGLDVLFTWIKIYLFENLAK